MKTAKYNGWANWETWNVHLWLTNDEAIYRVLIDHHINADNSDRQAARELKNWVEAMYEVNNHSFGDIQNQHELERVNWLEIVQNLRLQYA